MPSNPEAHELLKNLLQDQHLAVLATLMRGRPYTSLVAFAALEDLRRIAFVTSRATTKYRNLTEEPDVSVLIDSRTHSVTDFTTGAAVTAVGRAAEIPKDESGPLVARFLAKHPHLETFVRAPSTAMCTVEVETYYLVTRFQHVVEMDVRQWSSSNPSQR